MSRPRRPITRLVVSFAATAGLTVASVVWSESWFWGRWRAEDTALGLVETVVAYGLAVQVVRFVAFRWRVAVAGRGAWKRVLLAGALYGWLVEGIIVTTVVDDLPLTISYTGLAWHALFTVLLGWWWMPRQLARPVLPSLLAMAALGAGVGAWASFWRFEDGAMTPVLEYALFVTVTTVVAAAGLAVWWTFRDRAAPGPRGSAMAIVGLVVLAVLHGIDNPLTLLGPALVGIALVALIHTAPSGGAESQLLPIAGPAPWRNLWRLALVPVVGTGVFALITAAPEPIPTGWLFLIVTAPGAALLFALAWWLARRERGTSLV